MSRSPVHSFRCDREEAQSKARGGTQAKKHTLVMAMGERRPVEPRARGLGHPAVDHAVEFWLNLFYKQPSFVEWEERRGQTWEEKSEKGHL